MQRLAAFNSVILLVVCIFSVSALAQVLTPERERALKPKDSFKECQQCPEMVVVPSGSFTMGSPDSEKDRDWWESPQHIVIFSQPFAVGKFEVTVDQFTVFVTETGYDADSKCSTLEGYNVEERLGRSWRNPGYSQSGSHPAACLNWNDAKAYVTWLSSKTGKGYRLLTEAEWEYAARAKTAPGSEPRYSFGDNENAMCAYGNGLDQTAKSTISAAEKLPVFPCSDGYAYTAPVGSFSANGFGLYDMHGNVQEWTEDCYNDGYRGASANGSAWTSGDCSLRVLRGGSWFNIPRVLRSAARGGRPAGTRIVFFGIRVARTLITP
jgi:formylglycine-generating enzyme required for sulfatase activity